MEGLFTGPFEIKYIPDSGHWVQQEKPDLVNQYVRDFLNLNPPA
jgi:pimeloyl-ACP methyl ester carboxylesterase